MSSLLIAFVLSAGPGDAKPEPGAKASTERGYHEISKDMRDIMKREALAKSNSEKAAAICDLCTLYRELARDSRLELSDTLKEYKGTIRNRLVRSKSDIKAYLAREKRTAPKIKKQADGQELVASQAQSASQSLADQMALVSSSLGGPAKVFSNAAAGQQPAGGFGGGMADYGSDLVNLIERTIAPDTWENNGGNGSIVYYPGLMALVVRATSEVHNDTGALLDNLREAGR
jgi:hypothetical protein